MKDKILIFIIILLFLVGLKVISQGSSKIDRVVVGGETFEVEIADTNALRERGLSGHKPLLGYEGMLFVFPREGDQAFWMKDMLFPIDVIWIDKNLQITHIEKSLSPETYPTVFHSPTPSLYVLEVSAGVSERLNLKSGDAVKFLKK